MSEVFNPETLGSGAGITPAIKAQIIADAVSAAGGSLTAGVAGGEPTTGLVAFHTQYYDSTNLVKEIWDGTTWVIIGDGTISAAQIADISLAKTHASLAHAPSNAEPNRPISGTTLQKNALTPLPKQRLFDTDLGVEQEWDGTAWVSIPSTGTPSFTLITTAYTAKPSDLLAVNTLGGSLPITLPLAPTDLDWVKIVDYANTWASNNVTLVANGSTIMGAAQDMTLNISGASVYLLFMNNDWRLV